MIDWSGIIYILMLVSVVLSAHYGLKGSIAGKGRITLPKRRSR